MLDEKLAEFTKQKFSQYWLPQDIGFTKVHSLLKHGGAVALFIYDTMDLYLGRNIN
ncbi:hypothetical protein G5B47_13795 [Paenibacillus sp. 7124]|uniref:Uncharacterized protein n=1 Tax=Paenibacillus apii TaxID=1850370 RepID=A0A6M1PJU3_9BACL|nr:hypothetical protein [Paenibacillus apii]NGM83490.1 hypothetical protein [Paenibacillus apii]NJJ42446.1 hypothetical protein [Paenibacillus apii]